MKVIVAGGRTYKSTPEAKKWLIEKLKELDCHAVISGCANGADKFGEEVAEELKLEIYKYPANWKLNGLGAGFIRNAQMAEIADACILFPGGKGTANMKKLAEGKKLIIFEYDESLYDQVEK
jgi:predicted Rossmann-fold nucleotide-binding protein